MRIRFNYSQLKLRHFLINSLIKIQILRIEHQVGPSDWCHQFFIVKGWTLIQLRLNLFIRSAQMYDSHAVFFSRSTDFFKLSGWFIKESICGSKLSWNHSVAPLIETSTTHRFAVFVFKQSWWWAASYFFAIPEKFFRLIFIDSSKSLLFE